VDRQIKKIMLAKIGCIDIGIPGKFRRSHFLFQFLFDKNSSLIYSVKLKILEVKENAKRNQD
jgi:hypothetical protein